MTTYEQARASAEQMLADGATPDQVWQAARLHAASCKATAQAYRDAANDAEGDSR